MSRRTAFASLAVVVASLAFVASALALDIADASPPQGTVGVPYSFTFSLSPGSGSPGATWSISSGSLPPGLALSSNDRTALVYGTPTQAGTFGFYVMVRDQPGPWVCCTEEEFSITINEALVISNAPDLPVGNRGVAYGHQLSTAGGTATSWAITAGALPTGIQLTPEGAIVGTPTQTGVAQFTVKAADGDRTASKQLTLKVTEPMTLVAPKPEAIKLGRQFLVAFAVSGGLGPYTWAGLNLPPGVGVNPATGQVGGRPTKAGPLSVTVTVTDSLGASATGTATVTAFGVPAILTTHLPVAHAGKRFRTKLALAGGAVPLRFRLSGGAPAWLRLDPRTGVLSGNPSLPKPKLRPGKNGKAKRSTATRTYTVRVTASDALGQRTTRTLTLTVKA